jgi:site-specific recombinase XerD
VKPGRRLRWTDEQVDLIMPVLPVWNRRICAAIAMMAHRPSSLSRMNWGDVAWNERAIMVHSWKNSLDGIKLIGLSDQAFEFLREMYLEAMKSGRAKADDPIFVDETGKRFTVDHFGKVFARTREEVELPEELQAYALRHGFAQRLRKAGADIFAIKGLMGHSKLSTTEHYLETGIKEHSEAANLAKAPLRLVN